MKDATCPNCKVNNNVVKFGFTFDGRQRFACKKCKKIFHDDEAAVKIMKQKLERMEKKV